VKIRVILVMSVVALSSSAASAERLFSPMLGEISPPRPPRGIGTSTSHQPDLPAAVPVDQPEQKPNAAPAPVNWPEQKPTKQPEHKPSAAASPVKQPEHKPTKQPEQKRAAAPVLSKPGVVTIGPSAAAPRPPNPGNASQVPAFPAAQTLE
jgi:outer membrane biosynthesis protein TonB